MDSRTAPLQLDVVLRPAASESLCFCQELQETMAWRRLAQRCAPISAPAALLGLGAARCEDTMQVPRTKKTPKELPEYFVPKVPYPAWDADWDGRRRARAEAKKRGAPPPT